MVLVGCPLTYIFIKKQKNKVGTGRDSRVTLNSETATNVIPKYFHSNHQPGGLIVNHLFLRQDIIQLRLVQTYGIFGYDIYPLCYAENGYKES